MVMRPRDGFSPTTPQLEAGTRIDPAPSLASAKGTMPAATADAAPPEEPPGVTSSRIGLCVAPWSFGSVVIAQPFSGALDLPTSTKPAALVRRVASESRGARQSLSQAQELVSGAPCHIEASSLRRNGTPANGA